MVQMQNGGNNMRASTQRIADLTNLDGDEVVRIRRGKRWAKTTVADIAAGINGSDIVTIKQGRRHVRTTAQAIADLGSGGGYAASAVRIDGDTNTIERAAALAGVAESPVGMFSLWRKAAGTRRLVDNGNFLISQFGGGDGLSLYAENSDASEYVDASFDPAGFNDNAWHNLLMAWDADHVIGERVYQFYLDDVSLSPSAPDDSDNPCIIDYTAANWAILVGGSIFNMTDFEFDVADLFFAPGQYLDLSVEANRRKFISADGKPVDLGADGSTPTGTAPAVFFSGDATGFASNKGSGGAFVFTGALANAPTSPSD